MIRLGLKDDLLDAQLLRTVGQAPYGGADLGECLATTERIDGTDLDSWCTQWTATAERVMELAAAAEKEGHLETARLAYLRAGNYYRNAGVMLMGTPIDPRAVSLNSLQTECFRHAGELMAHPPQVIEIPFEGQELPGYFIRASADDNPRATVILTGGYDGTAEELYLFNGAAAVARGYNVLAFDGPGQGSALIQRGMTLRPDWETVIGAVIDFATSRNDVDAERIALIGLSLGGHLAPRAASAEPRLKACIADCGAFDLYESFLSRLPGPLAGSFANGHELARKTVGEILQSQVKKPTGGWPLRRGMLVHGKNDPLDLIDDMRNYSLKGRAEEIRCPTWIASAEGDEISATASTLFDALTVDDKVHVEFKAIEGAGDHCEAGARTLFHARAFGWLDRLLQPAHPGALGRPLPGH